MGKNENQMAKQACENAVDSKHYSTLGLWVPGVGNRVRIKNFAGSSNSSDCKVRVTRTAKIHKHLLCTGAVNTFSFHPRALYTNKGTGGQEDYGTCQRSCIWT